MSIPRQPEPGPSGDNGPATGPECRTLGIGGIGIRLSCDDRHFFPWLEKIAGYRHFISPSAGLPDAAANLRFRGRRGRGIWSKRSATTMLRRRGDEDHILHHDFLARSTAGFRKLDAILPREDIYAVDNLLRFLVSVHAPAHRGFLLHAATLVQQDEAYVFYGLSGAGKSTAAAASLPGRRCLAEDATLVRIDGGRPVAWATPLLHHPAEPPRPGGFPVRGFFRLAKTPRFRLTRISKAGALSSLMRRVLLYEGFHLSDGIFSACGDAAAGAAHYELGLALGEDFWPPLLSALKEEE